MDFQKLETMTIDKVIIHVFYHERLYFKKKHMSLLDFIAHIKVIRENIFACLFSVHNTISLSRHEQQMMRDDGR